MEITEQWIGKAAGGRVLKEARVLVRLGKIMNVTRKETDGAAVFQASIGSGNSPLRVVVKVMGPTQVKNLCSCAMSRSTGAMCEHAAAVLLAGIQPKETTRGKHVERGSGVQKANLNAELVPLDIRLSPQFPHEGIRAVHLRRAKDSLSSPANDADHALAVWLLQHTGQADATMLSLPEGQIEGFYRAACGHPRIHRGDTPLYLTTGKLRPPLEMEVDDGLAWLKLSDASDGLISLGNTLAAWDEVSGRMVLADRASGGKNSLFSTEDLVGGEWLEMETKQLIAHLPVLGDEYQLPDDLGGLDLREGVPVIELEIAGSTRTLQAKITAVYAVAARVPLGVSGSQSAVDFPIASNAPNTPNQWLVRNPEYEQSAISRLMESGFQILDASGSLFLRGEDEVIDFLTTSLPSLRKQWKVNTEEKLVHVESNLGRITPQIDMVGGGAGNDWLACDVSWQCNGEVLDRDTVRRLLQSGGRTMQLPRGGKAVISHFDAEVMEGFLLDSDPRQEDGRFYFPAQQSAYLQRLRAYYGSKGGESEEAEVSVPPLPDDLAKILRAYQSEGVDWLFRRAMSEGAALLADDMGLGKTLQTLAFIKLWKTHGPETAKAPALVVCPATLLGNWRDEAAKFVPDLSVLVMHGPRRKDYYEVMAAADIIVTSFALLDRDCAHYQSVNLGALILDEASAIRNPDTLAAKAARKVEAPVRIAITGTPVENGVRDLWSIFQFLMPSYLGGREDFRNRYELPCAAEVPDRAAMQRLRWRTSPFMLRRTKSLVAKDLPPKIESIVWCDPSPLQKEHYEGILRHGAAKVDELRNQSGSDGGARMQILTVLLRLRQSCCDLRLLDSGIKKKTLPEVSAKLARLMELLDEAQRGGHRVLVFSQFTSMLALIRDELDREDIDYSYLDGATRDRSAVVDRFQKANGPPVFLISLKAGGYGLTLTAADTVVLFDPWWNPAVEAQAADRIHRIGQTKPATIYKLITRGTVEEKILKLQEKKRNVISAAMGEVGDEASPMMSGLTDSEMLSLLE